MVENKKGQVIIKGDDVWRNKVYKMKEFCSLIAFIFTF